MFLAFAELKVLGAVLFSLSTARMFFEMERGSIGYHSNFTTNLDSDYGFGDGRLYYTGACTAVFKVTVTAAHTSDSTGIYFGEIRLNGVYASLPASLQRFSKSQRLPGYAYSEDGVHFETLVAMENGDYVSFWASSSTGDPIEFRDVTIVAHQVSEEYDCMEPEELPLNDGRPRMTAMEVMEREEVDLEIYKDVSTSVY